MKVKKYLAATPPPMTDTEAFARFCSNSWAFEETQQDAERAIRRAPISVKKEEQQSRERIAEAKRRSQQIKDSLNAEQSS